MPCFDVKVESNVKKTFRVAKIKSEFDLQDDKITERFAGDIKIPETWNIGVVVGPSGTGKSTIAKAVFGDYAVADHVYSPDKAVIDEMPEGLSVEEITKVFFSVGFASVPSWCKPYNVLSNGEKMRVDLARLILGDSDNIIFDEFTSVVDRNVAETMCIATHKALKKTDKRFIAVTCHYDVLNYIEPDWVFDTATMSMLEPRGRDIKNSRSADADTTNGENLAVITI